MYDRTIDRMSDGASEFLGSVFGKSGEHARSAIGVYQLPLDAPVEVEFVFEVMSD